tara:strand:+ start:171 stop:356 length:186 start_codon:yes stop_codon:yes gene_type:complete
VSRGKEGFSSKNKKMFFFGLPYKSCGSWSTVDLTDDFLAEIGAVHTGSSICFFGVKETEKE